MRNVIKILLVAGLVAWSGCVKVDVPETVDVNIKDNTQRGYASGDSLPVPSENSGDSMLGKATDAAKKMADTEFYADDVLTLPGKNVPLVAHCDIEDSENKTIKVEYRLGKDLLGTVTTPEDSTTTINWQPPKPGIYLINVSVSYTEKKTLLPKMRAVPLTVCVAKKNAPMMIVDLDHTVVGSGFFSVMMRMAKPMPEAAAVMTRLSKKITVIYLTHRPAALTNLSKNWLINYNFPAGPLLTNQDNKFSSGDYKGQRMKELRHEFNNIQIGIGDKDSDVQAYRVNNMRAFWIIKYKDKRKSVEKIVKTISPYRGDRGIEVVFDWEQIEQSIDGQRSFRVGLVEKQLKARAEELRRIEKSKKDKDDDDDDD